MSALAARRHCPGSNFISEFDYCHKTVAAGAVPLFDSGIGPRAEGSKRAPKGRRKAHRDARSSVAERLNDVPRQALEAIDVAPRRLPGAEIRGKFV